MKVAKLSVRWPRKSHCSRKRYFNPSLIKQVPGADYEKSLRVFLVGMSCIKPRHLHGIRSWPSESFWSSCGQCELSRQETMLIIYISSYANGLVSVAVSNHRRPAFVFFPFPSTFQQPLGHSNPDPSNRISVAFGRLSDRKSIRQNLGCQYNRTQQVCKVGRPLASGVRTRTRDNL